MCHFSFNLFEKILVYRQCLLLCLFSLWTLSEKCMLFSSFCQFWIRSDIFSTNTVMCWNVISTIVCSVERDINYCVSIYILFFVDCWGFNYDSSELNFFVFLNNIFLLKEASIYVCFWWSIGFWLYDNSIHGIMLHNTVHNYLTDSLVLYISKINTFLMKSEEHFEINWHRYYCGLLFVISD